MEKISPKMAAAFGVGFLGFIMAAYSYNKHHKPDYADNLVKHFSDDMERSIKEEEDINAENNNEQSVEHSVEQNNEQNNNKCVDKSVEQEVKNEIDKTGWAQFWKEEYTDIKNNKQRKQSNNKQRKQSNNNKQSKQSNKNIQRMQTV